MTTTRDPILQVARHGPDVAARVCCPCLTEADATAVDREFAALLAGPGPAVVTLDLAAVRFLGSMALGRLVALNRELRAAGGRLKLVNLAPHLRRVFAVCRLERLFDPAADGVRTGPSTEDVRALAYLKWEAAGRPDRDGAEFWLAAERDLVAGWR